MKTIQPPSWSTLLLRWLCASEIIEEVEGDLLEYYQYDLLHKGRIYADVNYALNALKFIKRSNMINSDQMKSSLMLRNAYKMSYRNALKHKLFSFLNLFGLTIGMTSAFFIFVYIIDELSYDGYHQDVNSIFRIVDQVELEDEFEDSAIVPSIWADGIMENIPEIESTTRIQSVKRFNPVIKYKDKIFTENSFVFVDTTLFKVLTYDFKYLDRSNPLSVPNSLIISDKMSAKYFGDENPLGKVLQVDSKDSYTVTGVFRSRSNDSFKFDFAAAFKGPGDISRWVHTFVKIKPLVDHQAVNSKIAQFIEKTYTQIEWLDGDMELQPIKDIHHHSNMKFEYSVNSSIVYIYLFSMVGLMILLITIINFVNIVTARATVRFKEIGLRKVVGATKWQVATQILFETGFYVGFAALASALLVLVFTPYFNDVTQKYINPFELLQMEHWTILTSILLVVIALAGLYPSILLSTFNLRNQNDIKGGPHSSTIRNGLVVFQFALTSIMIMGSIVITRQLDLFQNRELGFDKMSNLIVRVTDEKVKENYVQFREELLNHSGINQISFTQTFPGEREKMAVLIYKVDGSSETTTFATFLTDMKFTQTLGIELAAGRHLDNSREVDKNNCLINEKAAAAMGWTPDEAIGKEFHAIHLKLKGNVVGVTKDFNFSSLHQNIESVVMFPVTHFPKAFNAAIININPEHIEELVPAIAETWRKFSVEAPFEYELLDDNLNTLYQQDLTKGSIFKIFVAISIILSCIGLLGLTTYSLEKRTKEISIRKVLGATTNSITLLLSGTFMKYVLLANLIAIPIALWLTNKWLQEFSYRISLGADIFLIGGIISLSLALLTVIGITIAKSSLNPASQLKYE